MTRDDALQRAWESALAQCQPPIRRDAARGALLRALALASRARGKEAQGIRRSAETTLLVVESGGSAVARRRASTQWLSFARRRLRAHESVDDLAQMMRSVGITDLAAFSRPFARAFRRAWSTERLDALAEQGPRSDRKLTERWRATLVPNEPLDAFRFAYESLRRQKWKHAIACARVAQEHKTVTTRENARLVLLASLAHERKPDVHLLRLTITSFVEAAKRGRKVWTFDWRTLAALALAYDLDDAALRAALADAWRSADPTFAATALLE